MTGSTIAVDKTVKLGITLPKSIIQRIDKKRGDIPRSRYILRSIENYLSSSSSSSKETDNRSKVVKKRKR
jgi:metal-responsive CopG/Arc/MetJ family transcriptional regulator